MKINFLCIIQERIMEYYILKCYKEAKNKCPDVEQGFDIFEPKIKKIVIACLVAMFTSCAEIILTILLFPKQLWFGIGIIILLIALVILIRVDNKDQRNHIDKYVDSHKKKIEVLGEVLESQFQINNKEKIEELMNIYQDYIDKETSKEKQRNRIIFTIFSACTGALTISFTNMGVIGIGFTDWLYVATFLLVIVAAARIWLYSYTLFDTLKRKYGLMIKDLKELLLLKY